MLTRGRSALLVSLVFAVTGCMFESLSASQRFNESSFMLNDAARWGRLDVARSMVDGSYVQKYQVRHQDWGHRIQIAEADVVSLQLDEDKDGATSQVQVSWYSTDTMNLHASTIVQRWRADGQSFLLVDELIQGDPQLFADETTMAPSDPSDAAGDPTTKADEPKAPDPQAQAG